MKFVILPFFLLLFSSINIFAQHDDNLVFNGDFELLKSDSLIHDYLKTKEFDTQIDGWETPSYGSSDILSADFSYNHVSLQPKNGKYAIGIAVNVSYSKKEKKISRYFEYAQCKLKTPLKANKKYLVRFDICGKNLPIDSSQYFGINLNKRRKSMNFPRIQI